MNKKHRIFDCVSCNKKQICEVKAEAFYTNDEMDGTEVVLLAHCSECKAIIVESYYGESYGDSVEESLLRQIWPKPDFSAPQNYPEEISYFLQEAWVCFNAHAYNATVVMCGKTLEALCVNQGLDGEKYLRENLKSLKEKDIIDEKVLNWGLNLINEKRNDGAHMRKKAVSKEDARDSLDFTMAICEYIYTLTVKFNNFQKRQGENSHPNN